MRLRRVPQHVNHTVVALPAPTHGLNTVDSLAGMPPTDAVECDNLLPTEAGLTVRGGWWTYGANLDSGSQIKTIFAYSSAPSTSMTPPLTASTLFAVTDNGIFNVEGGGDLTGKAAAIALSGAIDAGHMNSVQFTTDAVNGGKQFLIACSETDGAFYYDGVTWKKYTYTTGSAGPGQVAGVDPALFVHVVSWKHRLGFTKRGSTEVWWLPPNAFSGKATVFDFGAVLPRGGMVLGCASWTQDAGDGIDDRLVVISSSGDVAIYEGTDPTTAATFSIAGVWYVGQPPVGRRCFTNTGGNVYLLTQYGVVPIAELMQGGLDTILTAGTDLLQQLRKIQSQLNEDFQFLLNTPGWALLDIPSLALLHIARPAISVTERVQYAFHKHSLAWSRIVDMDGYCFARRLSEVYAGTMDGRILRVFDGNTDGQLLDGTGAYEIRSRLTPAFNDFGAPAQVKRAQMVRCQFLAKAIPGYSVRMNVDYEINPVTGAPIGSKEAGSMWDLSMWDHALWSGGRSASGEWRTVAGMGYALAPTIFLATMAQTTIASIEYMTSAGGPL